MFGNTFRVTTPIPDMTDEVEQLRQDATQTAADIIDGVQANFVTNEQFHQQFNNLDSRINEILNVINNISQRLTTENEENHGYDRMETPRPSEDQVHLLDNTTSDTNYDLDNDVIMKTRNFSAPLYQVPEPGFFSGQTSETDLFCQLCEDTFKTAPYKYAAEETKINFVKSRLRESARNWYLTKYKNNIMPATLDELLAGLRTAFTNIASLKLAKIKLATIKQNYGRINEYIEEFREYTRQITPNEEYLAMMFYGGLHPRYQEEIQKAETFPTTLEDIITKCILFENSLKTKNKLNQTSSTKTSRKKNTNSHSGSYNNNNKNSNQHSNNYDNNRHYNNNYNKNYFNKNNQNKNANQNNDVSKSIKITSKN